MRHTYSTLDVKESSLKVNTHLINRSQFETIFDQFEQDSLKLGTSASYCDTLWYLLCEQCLSPLLGWEFCLVLGWSPVAAINSLGTPPTSSDLLTTVFPMFPTLMYIWLGVPYGSLKIINDISTRSKTPSLAKMKRTCALKFVCSSNIGRDISDQNYLEETVLLIKLTSFSL